MKKLLAVSLFISAIVGVAFIMPVAPALACDHACSLDVCRPPLFPQEGWWRSINFNNAETVLWGTSCVGSAHMFLSQFCEEDPCIGTGAGIIYTAANQNVYAFVVRDTEEREDILQAIETNGLESLVKAHRGKKSPTVEFEKFHNQIRIDAAETKGWLAGCKVQGGGR